MFKEKMMCLGIFVAFLSLSGFAFAGNLEPTAPPAPTMKTLDEIPPTWSQKLPAADRFELVLDGAAVLDYETGLVWEQAPDELEREWNWALHYCYKKTVGDRNGWRAPTIGELASLPDGLSLQLPDGHPFDTGLEATRFWTSTTDPADLDRAYMIAINMYGIATFQKDPGLELRVWCVRGGQGHDGLMF